MNANLSALLYLVAGVLFILSLRGLSSPASSRQGNLLGMIGMVIAILTTLAAHPPADGLAWLLVVLGIAIGVAIGALTFTGSVIAFLKLSGRMSGAPIILPARHIINIVLGLALIFFIYGLVHSG
ncbi:MAG: NAD(P)(+) transhydrogenase (Re/Si-specific) subunit beta, partial [Rhizobiales bacterium]|nr:NAD(P)(+) transhydrogenase (Re/Si-specific) subunit beta [Hyphomicrobiales bacterium]